MENLSILYWSVLVFGFLFAPRLQAVTPDVKLASTIVKVVAQASDGKRHMGSGVIVAANKVATNCHVTRAGRRIIVLKSGQYYQAIAQAALPEFDVCLLKTDRMPLPKAPMAAGYNLKLGDNINIYGYPLAMGMRVKAGAIVGLHRYDDQQVIEINAGFMQGASGGAVFNQAGQLIGLTTFMGRKKDSYHFYAIPAAWLILALKTKFYPVKPFSHISFWESGKFEH
ncbi:MAG: S1 family peptidase [Gammaproteobacteria bacterium]